MYRLFCTNSDHFGQTHVHTSITSVNSNNEYVCSLDSNQKNLNSRKHTKHHHQTGRHGQSVLGAGHSVSASRLDYLAQRCRRQQVRKTKSNQTHQNRLVLCGFLSFIFSAAILRVNYVSCSDFDLISSPPQYDSFLRIFVSHRQTTITARRFVCGRCTHHFWFVSVSLRFAWMFV